MARPDRTTAEHGPDARGFSLAGTRVPVPRPAPGLYVVATPIGNLGDVTLRALETLAGADAIVCEDTRHSRRLLDRYGIRRPLLSYHENNARRRIPVILARLAGGAALALISDAGTPLVSDPGYRLVSEAVAADVAVTPIPGPSAGIAALSASGLPTDAFLFAGFLPARPGPRRSRLASLAATPATLILYEAPQRLGEALADMAEILGGERRAVVAREITKEFETFARGTLADLAARYSPGGAVKGEVVVLVAPGEAPDVTDADADRLLADALAEMPASAAAASVARATGRNRKSLYARALALKERS